jgi:hypothetical protein
VPVGDYDPDAYSGFFSTSEAVAVVVVVVVVVVEVGLASNIDGLQILPYNVAWARFCCNHRMQMKTVVEDLLHV